VNIQEEIEILKSQNTELQKKFEHFKERIKATEADRTRERGVTRTLIICLVIYFVALLFALLTHGHPSVFVSASFPVIGFAVSSILIHVFRIRHHHKTVVQKSDETRTTEKEADK